MQISRNSSEINIHNRTNSTSFAGFLFPFGLGFDGLKQCRSEISKIQIDNQMKIRGAYFLYFVLFPAGSVSKAMHSLECSVFESSASVSSCSLVVGWSSFWGLGKPIFFVKLNRKFMEPQENKKLMKSIFKNISPFIFLSFRFFYCSTGFGLGLLEKNPILAVLIPVK